MVNRKQADIPVPPAMQHLPLTNKGYHKPWFVKDNDPRIINQDKYITSMTKDRCWVCGGANRKTQVFVTDLRSAFNSVSLEPPCHEACAEYSIQVCPFLLLPNAKRRTAGLPETHKNENYLKEVAHTNPGIYVLSYVRKFKFQQMPNTTTKMAHWQDKHVIKQVIWSEGQVSLQEPGPIDKSVLKLKIMAAR